MKLKEFAGRIEKTIPLGWAEEWDNPGLTFGDPEAEISKVGVALDATLETVAAAADAGCNLLFTHHPLIFVAMRKVIADVLPQRVLIEAIRRNVALYAAHTNWDSSPEGVNFTLAAKLGLKNIERLQPDTKNNGSVGIGAVGDFPAPKSIEEIMLSLDENCGAKHTIGFGGMERKITRAAVGGGACGGMWGLALAKGAELFITADIAYHERNEALFNGLAIITADHGEMERASMPELRAVIERETGVEAILIPEAYVERINH